MNDGMGRYAQSLLCARAVSTATADGGNFQENLTRLPSSLALDRLLVYLSCKHYVATATIGAPDYFAVGFFFAT